jgi:hypothetical protein
MFDQSAVAVEANHIIDDLIREIHRELPRKPGGIQRDLCERELALLYRFPIHVGVNIFIERLLRACHAREMKLPLSCPEGEYQPHYFKNTDEAVTTHYVDYALNYHILRRIYETIGAIVVRCAGQITEQPRPQDILLNKPHRFADRAKKTIKRSFEYYVKICKPAVVGEYSNWMRDLLPVTEMLSFDLPVRHYPDENLTRTAIRNCCRTVFLRGIDRMLPGMPDDDKKRLSVLFSDFIDHIIPQSIVESLEERFSYFEGLIKNWEVKQVHSFVGYYYNENFKIFALLARRKGALLIGHAHGASNPVSTYKQCSNELAFLDVYFTWGKKDCNWLKGRLQSDGPKIISLGSAYLSGIRKWDKRRMDPGKILLLYASGPWVEFMGGLQEITPERNYRHRLNVLALLKGLRQSYPGLKILYKPFPGTFTNDPIKSFFADAFRDGSLELVHEKPLALYGSADVVLWDTVSTGFCESISSGVPTLVFQPQEEYEQSVPLGRELDRELMACGMLFHDTESGFNSFSRVIQGEINFLGSCAEAVRKFQEATAYPVGKDKLRWMFNAVLTSR